MAPRRTATARFALRNLGRQVPALATGRLADRSSSGGRPVGRGRSRPTEVQCGGRNRCPRSLAGPVDELVDLPHQDAEGQHRGGRGNRGDHVVEQGHGAGAAGAADPGHVERDGADRSGGGDSDGPAVGDPAQARTEHEQFARDDERVQGGGPGPSADRGVAEPVLAGDLGEVRVGEPERAGGQGDDDDAGRDERVLLGSRFVFVRLPPRTGPVTVAAVVLGG